MPETTPLELAHVTVGKEAAKSIFFMRLLVKKEFFYGRKTMFDA